MLPPPHHSLLPRPNPFRCLPNRSTIERHLLSSATDPFSRAPLAADALLPEEQLRQQIADWLAQRRVHQAAAARAAESGAQGTAS